MKPRNREINIFNLSMLDVISGAMGAFLIIMVVLLPYYKKDSVDLQREIQQMQQQLSADQEAARQAVAQAEQARQQAEAEAERNRQAAEAAQRQLAKTFLVVHILWKTPNQDIDLHVVDPSGAEFYYKQPIIAGRASELSVDSLVGPGNEVWTAHDAAAGDYRIYANLFKRGGNPADPVVKGKIIHRDGATALPDTVLHEEQKKVLMATVTVAIDGTVTVH